MLLSRMLIKSDWNILIALKSWSKFGNTLLECDGREGRSIFNSLPHLLQQVDIGYPYIARKVSGREGKEREKERK